MSHAWRYAATVVFVSAATIAGAQSQPPAGRPQPAPENRPYYVKALTELREARELLQPTPGEQPLDFEKQAMEDIDSGVRLLEGALGEDGKPTARGPGNLPAKRLDRYYAAVRLLGQCQRDVMTDRDPATRGLRLGAAGSVARARQAVARAIGTIAGTG
jgi:hypothetical protein